MLRWTASTWRRANSWALPRGNEGLEGLVIDGVVGVRLERDVDRVALARALAVLLDEAGPGEEPVPALVGRDRQHVRVGVEGELDAVAMVGVDVHVGEAPAALAHGE